MDTKTDETMSVDKIWSMGLDDYSKVKEIAWVFCVHVFHFISKHPIVILVNVTVLLVYLYLVKSRNQRARHALSNRRTRRRDNTVSTRRSNLMNKRGGGVVQHLKARQLSQVNTSLQSRPTPIRRRRSRDSYNRHYPELVTSNYPRSAQQCGSRTWPAGTTDDEEASTLNEVTWSNDPSSATQFKVRHGTMEFGMPKPRNRLGFVDKLSDVPEETEKTTSRLPNGDGDDTDASSKIGSVEEEIHRHDDIIVEKSDHKETADCDETKCKQDYESPSKLDKLRKKNCDSPDSNQGRGRSRQKRKQKTPSPRQKLLDREAKGSIIKPSTKKSTTEEQKPKHEVLIKDRQTINRASGSPVVKGQNRRRVFSNESPRKRNREWSNEISAPRSVSEEKNFKNPSSLTKGYARHISIEDKTRGSRSNSRERCSANFVINKGQPEGKQRSPRRKLDGSNSSQTKEWNRKGNINDDSGVRESVYDAIKDNCESGQMNRECNTVAHEADDCKIRSPHAGTTRHEKVEVKNSGRRGSVGFMGFSLTRGPNRQQARINKYSKEGDRNSQKRRQNETIGVINHKDKEKDPDVQLHNQKIPSASSHSMCSSGGGERALAGQRSDVTLVGKRDSWIWFSHETKPSVENFATRRRRFQSKDPRVAELAAEIRRQEEMNKAIEREAGSIAETTSEMIPSFSPNKLAKPRSTLATDVSPHSDRTEGSFGGDDFQSLNGDTFHDRSGGSCNNSGRVLFIEGEPDNDNRQSDNVIIDSNIDYCANQEYSTRRPRVQSKQRTPKQYIQSEKRDVMRTPINKRKHKLCNIAKTTEDKTPTDKNKSRSSNDTKAANDKKRERLKHSNVKPYNQVLKKVVECKSENLENDTILEQRSFPGVLVVSPVISNSSDSLHSSTAIKCDDEANKCITDEQNNPSPSRSHYYVSTLAALTNNTLLKTERRVKSPSKLNSDVEPMSCASTKASTSSLLNVNQKQNDEPMSWSSSMSPKHPLAVHSSPMKTSSITHKSTLQGDTEPVPTMLKPELSRLYPFASPPKTSITPEPFVDNAGSSVSFASEKCTSKIEENKTKAPVALGSDDNMKPFKIYCKRSFSSSKIENSPHTQSINTSTFESSDSVPKEKLSKLKEVVLNNEVKDSVCKILFDTEQSTSSASPKKKRHLETKPSFSVTKNSSPNHYLSQTDISRWSPANTVRHTSRRARRTINVFDSEYYLGKKVRQKVVDSFSVIQMRSNAYLKRSLSATKHSSSISIASDISYNEPRAVSETRYGYRSASSLDRPENSTNEKDQSNRYGSNMLDARPCDSLTEQRIDSTSPVGIDYQECITNVKQPQLLDDTSDNNVHALGLSNGETETSNKKDMPYNQTESTAHKNNRGKNEQPTSSNYEMHFNPLLSDINVGNKDTKSEMLDSSDQKICLDPHAQTSPQKADCNDTNKGSVQQISPVTRMTPSKRPNLFPRSPTNTCNALSKANKFCISNQARNMNSNVYSKETTSNGPNRKVGPKNINVNNMPILKKQGENTLRAENEHSGLPENAHGNLKPRMYARPCFNKRHVPVSTLISGLSDLGSKCCNSSSSVAKNDVGFVSPVLWKHTTADDLSFTKLANKSPLQNKNGSFSSLGSECCLADRVNLRCETRNITHLKKTPNFYGKARMRITRAEGLIHDPAEVSPVHMTVTSSSHGEHLDNQMEKHNNDKHGDLQAVVSKAEVDINHDVQVSLLQNERQQPIVRKSSVRSFRSESSAHNAHQKLADTTYIGTGDHFCVSSGVKDNTKCKPSVIRTKFRLDGKCCGESGSTNNSSSNVRAPSDAYQTDQSLSSQPPHMIVTHHEAPLKKAEYLDQEVYRLDQAYEMDIPNSYWLSLDSNDVVVNKEQPHVPTNENNANPKQNKRNSLEQLHQAPGSVMKCRENLSSSLRKAHALVKSQKLLKTFPSTRWGGNTVTKTTLSSRQYNCKKKLNHINDLKSKPDQNSESCQMRNIPQRNLKPIPQTTMEMQTTHTVQSNEDNVETHMHTKAESSNSHLNIDVEECVMVESILHCYTKPFQQNLNPDSGYDEIMSITESTGCPTFPVSHDTCLFEKHLDSCPAKAEKIQKPNHVSIVEERKQEVESLDTTVELYKASDEYDEDIAIISSSNSVCSSQGTNSVNTDEAFLSPGSSDLYDPGDQQNNPQQIPEAILKPSPDCSSKYFEPCSPTPVSKENVETLRDTKDMLVPYEYSHSSQHQQAFNVYDPDTEYDVVSISEGASVTSLGERETCKVYTDGSKSYISGIASIDTHNELRMHRFGDICHDEDQRVVALSPGSNITATHPQSHASDAFLSVIASTDVSVSSSPLEQTIQGDDVRPYSRESPCTEYTDCNTKATHPQSHASDAFLSVIASKDVSVSSSPLEQTIQGDDVRPYTRESPQDGSIKQPTNSRTPSIECICLCMSPSCNCKFEGSSPVTGSSIESLQDSFMEVPLEIARLSDIDKKIQRYPNVYECDNRSNVFSHESETSLPVSVKCILPNYTVGKIQSETNIILKKPNSTHEKVNILPIQTKPDTQSSNFIPKPKNDIDPTLIDLPPSSSDEEDATNDNISNLEKKFRSTETRCFGEKFDRKIENNNTYTGEQRSFTTVALNKFHINSPVKTLCTQLVQSCSEQCVSRDKGSTEHQSKLAISNNESAILTRSMSCLQPKSISNVDMRNNLSASCKRLDNMDKRNLFKNMSHCYIPKSSSQTRVTVSNLSSRLAHSSGEPSSESDKTFEDKTPTPAQKRVVIGRRSMAFEDLIKRF